MPSESGEARRKGNKRRAYLSQVGRPALVTGPGVDLVRGKISSYHAKGMSYAQMEAQTGVPFSTISMLMNRGEEQRGIYRRNYEAYRALRFEEPAPGVLVSSTGTIRRLKSLWHDGFTLDFQAGRLGVVKPHLQRLILGAKGEKVVTYGLARSVADLYETLAASSPEDYGIPPRSVAYCRTFSLKKGAVPRSCWDADTIDDPAAEPEWTGRCGTWWGWHIHQRDGVPMCGRCAPFADADPYPGFNGLRLRALRERKGYSRERLAQMVGGLNASTIQYWESGRSKPVRQNKIDRVLSVLDATLDDVCE